MQPLITATDAQLAAALEDANLPIILSVLYQLTRNEQWLQAPYTPGPVILQSMLDADDSGRFDAQTAATIRTEALRLFGQIRDGKVAPVTTPLDAAAWQRAMNAQTGAKVPEAVVPMMLEEMHVIDRDPHLAKPPAQTNPDFKAVVIGAGLSGVCIAAKLEAAGIPYVVFDKNKQIGGTWYENAYPACGVDTPNHFYSYSFCRNNDWSGYFSKRDELLSYVQRCADRLNIQSKVRLGTEVVGAAYQEKTRQWRITVRHAQGKTESVFANVLISAVGQLNRPKMPDIAGLDSFQGPVFHSARWQYEHALKGKRVAVIGTGCSAQQFLPWTAETASKVHIFQRSPHWMVPNPDYYRPVEEGLKWCLNNLPHYAEWNRFRQVWRFADQTWPAVVKDDDWQYPERAVSAVNDQMRIALTDFIKAELGDRQDLLPKVLPDFPVWGKRLQVYNGWYQQLKKDNVELICGGIRKITETSVIADSGQEVEVDMIILGTGFHANLFLHPINMIGATGVPLAELWGDDPRAYKGMTVPDFPNLFCLYGPNTNIVHGGSVIFQVEAQVRYIMSCLTHMLDNDIAVMACRPEVNAAYNKEVQAISERLAWGHPNVSSWYKNSSGRVVNNSPYSLHQYWAVTHDPDFNDYYLEYRSKDGKAA